MRSFRILKCFICNVSSLYTALYANCLLRAGLALVGGVCVVPYRISNVGAVKKNADAYLKEVITEGVITCE